MTRRWSLITTIAVLTVALAFVVVQLVRGQDSGKEQVEAKPAASSPDAGAESLQGLGWWPLHQSGTAKVGEYDAVVSGGTQWTDGPEGGALRLDGTSGYVDTNTRLDTVDKDYSVAARVRLTDQDMTRMRTAVSQDGDRISTFFLQYSGQDGNFAFSFGGARTVAETPEKPQSGRWYHLTGTYSQKDLRMRVYVDGQLAATRVASNSVKPTGAVVIGRGKFAGKAADFWNGDIADVHVYDRELTPREVGSLSSNEPG
ncbi:LamG domain-containing protein [Streptomyces acidicola]|uniref:LamG domain-containing protein n=1 Tax=Streptomyces acidicola TaxID=2596892 RepID=A0A5N8WUP1_9ACTN|nr:LamG domain-containing protein [Streptomyces acidicola]MPY50354.1 LamG domain-containing protein [Streptomyces acidicola]